MTTACADGTRSPDAPASAAWLEADVPAAAGPEAAPAARFGVRLGAVPVLMPPGTPLEFVADTAIHPLPLAPARVAGLMQLRGQPMVVLDAATPPAQRDAARRHAVLVVGQPPEAAALLVDAPPVAVDVGGAGDSPAPSADACAYADALGACVSARGEHAGCWYEVEPARLFDALAHS